MLRDEMLIITFLPVDGLAASARTAREVTTLARKSQNNSVKTRNFITKSFLPCAQSMKVFCSLWHFANSLKMRPKGSPATSKNEEHSGVDPTRLGRVAPGAVASASAKPPPVSGFTFTTPTATTLV